MSIDSLSREETKSRGTTQELDKGATTTSPSIRAVDSGLAKMMTCCWEKPPTTFNPLVPEWVPSCDSACQSQLVAQSLSQRKPKASTRRIAIRPANQAQTKDFTRFLEAGQAELLRSLIAFYQPKPNDFVYFRYGTIKFIFPTLKLKGTQFERPENTPISAEKHPVDDLKVVVSIKDAAYLAYERCLTFATTIHKELANPAHPEYKETRNKYTKYWRMYCLSALEINTALAPLNAIINEATTALLPSRPNPLPQFSVWRLLVGIFSAVVYLPNLADLRMGLIQSLKDLGREFIRRRVPAEQLEDTSVSPPIENFMKAQRQAFRLWTSLLDLDLNEASAHFLKSKALPSKLCEDISKPLSDSIKELDAECTTVLRNAEQHLAWVGDERRFLKQIFPPRLWDVIDKACAECEANVSKADIRTRAENFSKLSEEAQLANTSDLPTDTDWKPIERLLSNLKSSTDALIIRGDKKKKCFISYLYQQQPDLLKRYNLQKAAITAAESGHKRVEDYEIEIKNRALRISIQAEHLEYFPLVGVSEPELSMLCG